MLQTWNAELYDAKHAFVWQHGATLVDLLAPKRGERILDLGCGTGHLTAQLAASGAEVIGIDTAPSMIEQARRQFPDLQFKLADARDLPFPAASLDAVFSNAVLHWVRPPELVVASVARVLVPGGRFVVEFGARGNVRAIVDGLQGVLHDLAAPAWQCPWYFPSIAEYTSLLESHGFETTFATLFDRPTALDGPAGLRDWVRMFAASALECVPSGQQAMFLEKLEERVRPLLYGDGSWSADYRRLRVCAQKF